MHFDMITINCPEAKTLIGNMSLKMPSVSFKSKFILCHLIVYILAILCHVAFCAFVLTMVTMSLGHYDPAVTLPMNNILNTRKTCQFHYISSTLNKGST